MPKTPPHDEPEEEQEPEDFGGRDLAPPPLPPRPMRGGGGIAAQPACPPPAELIAIAGKIASSTDALERQTLAHQALLASMADVLADPTISAEMRRRELRTISAAAAKLFPYARLYDAEQTVKASRAELEQRKRDRAGALLERRAVGGGANVIPIRGSAVPRGDSGIKS